MQTFTKISTRTFFVAIFFVIDSYIFWLLSSSPFSDYFCDARLPLSLKRTCFCRFLLSLGGFGHLAIRLSTDPHLKHLQGVRSVFCLSESPAAQDFFLSFLIILNNFSAEWLVPPQKVNFSWTRLSLSLILPEPELLSIFK